MAIILDPNDFATVKQLHRAWKQAQDAADVLQRQADAFRATLDTNIDQLSQLKGFAKEDLADFTPENWVADEITGKLSRVADEGVKT